MEIRQLRNVVALAEYRSFGKAATALHLSQSALSISVKNLEDALGSRIFVRSRKDVIPTDFGAEFLVRARAVLREVEKATELAQAMKGNVTRLVRVGIDSILAGPILNGVTPQFVGAFPNARLEADVSTGTIAESFRRVSSGDWDLGVVLAPESVSIPSGFTVSICARLTSYAHARKGHPLASRRKVSLEALARQNWVLSTRLSSQAVIAACANVGLNGPAVVARVNSFELLRGLIQNTEWLTILPSEIIDRYYGADFVRFHSDTFVFRTNLLIIHARDLKMTSPAGALIQTIKATIGAEMQAAASVKAGLHVEIT
jgi:DNA-binding transcriptional LysR family regulator